MTILYISIRPTRTKEKNESENTEEQCDII
jgi:hypothetical protein